MSFFDAIGKFIKVHPPLCDTGGELFLSHVKLCPQCRARLIDFLTAIHKEMPMLRIMIPKDKITGVVDLLNQVQ